MYKFPVVNRQEYIMYLELFSNLYWLHTDVFKWSAETKKHYIRDLNQLQSLLNAPLYAMIDNGKLSKFSKTIGFEYLKNLIGNDGNVYQINVRSL
jgi:hypothetical protein